MTNQPTRPLAVRYRPQRAEDLIGQEAIWNPQSALWKLVHSKGFHSLLLWGPPGTGKTSLARLIGKIQGAELLELSAVEAGVKDIREAIERSRALLRLEGQSLILFLDEVHRLNKNQQDSLLPAVEAGEVKLIGVTTENPSFSVNNALLSRSLTIAFHPVSAQTLASHLKKIARQEERELADDLAQALAEAADGDVRSAMNLLEAVLSLSNESEAISLEGMRPLLAMLVPRFDKKGDFHYDLISAFIKSIRASDPDATLYYLARLLRGGEDPAFIARRLVIAASEDIGNALPTALLVAQSALLSVKEIGMPEARIILAQAATYLASSPKSNRSYLAIGKALKAAEETGDLPVPLHLRNAPSKFLKSQDYGKDYIYAHDDPQKAAAINNMPDQLKGRKFYEPSQHGSEKAIFELLQKLRAPQPLRQ